MNLSLYNSLTRRKETFTPLSSKRVTMYTCGPTVYDFVHIGNLRTFVLYDFLKRTFGYFGYDVQHVMNITDVGHLVSDADAGEDKMQKGARREGKTAWEVARFYTEAFQKDLGLLNILQPDTWCKATDYIPEQIALIAALEKNGFTYTTSDGIYFDTSKVADYGKLALLDAEGMKEGARVTKNDEKKHATDFALWKFSPKGVKRDMEWPSPWGVGFPGWHIECSAMSMKHLGETIDVHAGGIDLRQIHHVNEIAQSEAATGKTFARYWLHGEFLRIDGKRMGKSLGNFVKLEDFQKEGVDPLAFRVFLLQTHYRKIANFSWEAVRAAEKPLAALRRFCAEHKDTPPGEIHQSSRAIFREALADDVNLPLAWAETLKVFHDHNLSDEIKLATILDFDRVLGLGLSKVQDATPNTAVIPERVRELVREREEARRTKHWKEADMLRKKIEDAGFVVEDEKEGPVVKRK